MVVLKGKSGMAPRHSSHCVGHCMLGVVPGRLVPGEEYMEEAVEGCSWKLKCLKVYIP